jgi:hypothetical protein
VSAWIKSLVLPAPAVRDDGSKRRLRWITYAVKISVVLFVVAYLFPLLWNASWIRGYDLHYPAAVLSKTDRSVGANEAVTVQEGTGDTRTCDRSRLVDMQIKLIDFMVNENAWMPSMPQYKLGLFTLIPWDDTPFLDNKAAFQHGVLMATRRTAVELADTIGRVRGTSKADDDLLNARGALQYDSETWWFNPFDHGRPFGPIQPSQYSYRKAMDLFDGYNERLDDCKAVLDARPDNLRSYMDRIANDLGSIADGLNKRSQAVRYDPKTDTFVDASGNDAGWFDMRADNMFHEASGLLYAYHGLLQAARVDFAEVEERRQLTDIWDRLEENLADAASLSPWIVSNGRKDGFLMPDHLAVMTQVILTARANLSELRDILDR